MSAQLAATPMNPDLIARAGREIWERYVYYRAPLPAAYREHKLCIARFRLFRQRQAP